LFYWMKWRGRNEWMKRKKAQQKVTNWEIPVNKVYFFMWHTYYYYGMKKAWAWLMIYLFMPWNYCVRCACVCMSIKNEI
jgi:hypothetical protein